MMARTVLMMTMMVVVAAMVGGCGTPTADEMYAQAQATHDAAQKAADSLGRKADFAALFTPVAAAYERVAFEHPSSLTGRTGTVQGSRTPCRIPAERPQSD